MTTNNNILLLNGPNLNLLGKREPEIYGSNTLEDVVSQLQQQAMAAGFNLSHLQSNSESELIERIHSAMDNEDFIVINPGAFTHTSIAIRDALLGVNIPVIEVHISNVHSREAFRHHSYISDIAVGVVAGFGIQGYGYALEHAIHLLNSTK